MFKLPTSRICFNFKNFLESPHKCFVCGKTYTRKIILENHSKSHEENPLTGGSVRPTFLCDYCPKIYTRKQYLKAHISIHKQGKKFHLDILISTQRKVTFFSFSQNPITSVYTATNCLRRKSTCKIIFVCTQEVNCILTLFITQQLMPSFLETPFKCTKCPKQFRVMKLLKAHIVGRCDEPKTFVCYICSKPMTKQSSVTNHIKYVFIILKTKLSDSFV